MAIRTKTEMLDKIKSILGDNTDDDSLAVIEDINDTFDDYENKTKDSTNWKQKYEDNDKEWREKYRDRFYRGTKNKEENNEDDDFEEEKPKKLTYENLFTDETK